MAAVLDVLRSRNIHPDTLARVQRPEGLATKTLLPAEIAFSVMAELLRVRGERLGLTVSPSEATLPRAARGDAVDPICGMKVSVASAHYRTKRDGQTYYFCCAGCQAKFEAA
jgi:xanthine dehydrogenase accessory factor